MRILAIGSTARQVVKSIFRVLRTDDQGRLEVVTPAASTIDVNIEEVDGVAVSSAAGVMDVAVTSIPETEVDVTKVAGSAVASTGEAGTVPVEGTQAPETATRNSAFPIPIQQTIREVLATITDDYTSDLFGDRYGRLRVRDASYDALSGGNRVESLNDPSTNHSYNSITWGDETDGAVSKNYYPSSAGTDIGDRSIISAIVSARDGSWGLEVANDDDWVDVTASLRDEATDRTGYGAAHFTEPDTATVSWAVSYQNQCKFKKFRFHFTPADATSVFEVQGFGRAM